MADIVKKKKGNLTVISLAILVLKGGFAPKEAIEIVRKMLLRFKWG